ncbi:MAG: inositol 2-dehydrogenase [Ardenticatenaceae bacterium]|nr:inositol 2-dehydrogenase [Ardenticatenaceae bacterium]
MTQKLSIGLIGAGRIGKVHAQSIANQVADAEIVRVADALPDAAAAIGQQYNIPFSDNYKDVLQDDAVKAILICSSTDTHAQMMIEAAAAGKHIFCEKPIDHDLSRIDAALSAVERAGVKLMIGFNRRFDLNFQKVKETISSGAIGEPHLLKITSRDPAPPPISYIKVSGGLFMDMTIHDFDMARFLFGEVEEVFATGGVLVDPAIGEAGDIDTAIITLKFANGAMGTIDNSRQAVYGYDQRVEAFGSEGMVEIKNNLPNTHAFYGADGVVSEKPLYFFLERYMDAYGREMAAFVDCVVHDKPSPVTGQDGRAPVVIAMAALKSLQENRPVKLIEIS